jgi:diheme cytochrome c
MTRLAVWIGLSVFLTVQPAAAEGTQVPLIDDATVVKQCGACHLAFPPQFLPARSWLKIMSDLHDHFGEDASVPVSQAASIQAYLSGHAADTPGTVHGARYMRGIATGAAPLRITETPYWLRVHEEVSKSQFAKVKSPANCSACHAGAAQGQFTNAEEGE